MGVGALTAGTILFEAGTSGAVGSGISTENITSGLSSVWDVVTSCVNFIGSSPVMLVFLAGGLVPIGFKIFKRAKRSVK